MKATIAAIVCGAIIATTSAFSIERVNNQLDALMEVLEENDFSFVEVSAAVDAVVASVPASAPVAKTAPVSVAPATKKLSRKFRGVKKVAGLKPRRRNSTNKTIAFSGRRNKTGGRPARRNATNKTAIVPARNRTGRKPVGKRPARAARAARAVRAVRAVRAARAVRATRPARVAGKSAGKKAKSAGKRARVKRQAPKSANATAVKF